MSWRVFPKILLWMMLVISSLGAVSQWVTSKPDSTGAKDISWLEQQMAISAATSFAQEWMTWDGDESPAQRSNRMKPYVSRSDLPRITQLKMAAKGNIQRVAAAEFVSLRLQGAGRYRVRVRVTVMHSERSVWEVDVPVLVQPNQGANVTDPPLIRPAQDAPELPVGKETGIPASNEVKSKMQPTVESFLKAMCEAKEAGSLVNYVGNIHTFLPLQGRVAFVSVDAFTVTGSGPYRAKVTFTVQDAATGTMFTQVWNLTVTEENEKFFVQSVE